MKGPYNIGGSNIKSNRKLTIQSNNTTSKPTTQSYKTKFQYFKQQNLSLNSPLTSGANITRRSPPLKIQVPNDGDKSDSNS